MAFDGIVTCAVTAELSQKLTLGKIEKIYQPEADELVFNIHTKNGNKKLYVSCASSHARVHLTEETFENPAQPMSFCMLMRKHLQGGRIQSITQMETERIIEFNIETMNELGFSVNKRLIIEIMGKHSNIILVDMASGKIIDCIKRVSIDVNRVRQLLPGKIYEYPPSQNKKPFFETDMDFLESCCSGIPSELLSKTILSNIQGVSPSLADSIAENSSVNLAGFEMSNLVKTIVDMQTALRDSTNLTPVVYFNESDIPCEFHVFPLASFETACKKQGFEDISSMLEFFYKSKSDSNRVKQKTGDLERALKASLDKLYLKKQRLAEDILKAENSEDYRLYGELITANLHSIKQGADKTTVINYYDGQEITIPLDSRFPASKNAQIYFKKYGKSKTAIKEKAVQLEETNMDIEYLESTLTFAENAASIEQTEAIREELIENGYLRRRKNS